MSNPKDASWLDVLAERRKALYSTVVVVETNDERRVKQFLNDLTAKQKKVLIWDTYAGLTMREEGKDRPYADNDDFMSNPASIVGKYLASESKGTVVIKNILAQTDLPMKAINLWSTSDEIYASDATLVIFVPDKSLIDIRVLDKCILIQPPLSLPDERYSLLDFLLTELKMTLDRNEIDSLVQLTGGLDLNQVEAVFAETLLEFGRTNVLNTALVGKAKADSINKSSILKVKMNSDRGFESIGGYEGLKTFIKNKIILPIREPARASALGVEQPRGFIMFGPGGTGKTVFAKALAKELAYPFVTLSPENFMSSYVGESERNLSKAIRIIEDMSPCIVFIDEIDRLGGRGETGENDGGTARRTFSQLLEWLGDEKRNSIVIGATNMPYMDVAFRREGRFDVMVPMLSPDPKARMEILKVHLNVVRKVKHNISDDVLAEVAEVTTLWKGNMLEELVKRAARVAFERGATTVEAIDLKAALDDYTPSKDSLKTEEDKYRRMADELCNSKAFLAVVAAEQSSQVSGRMANLTKKKSASK